MLPRAALHQENVISNEQLNRQRVEAGQIAPIFSVSTWSTVACAFVIRIHYASLHICRFLCEVACLSVKWTMYTHSKHVIMCTRTVLSRTWLQVQEALKVKFRHTAQQDHRRIQREVIQHNLLHPCVHLHRFLHRCVQSMNFSDHSRSVLFFSPSLISLFVSLLLSQDTMFFFTYIIRH